MPELSSRTRSPGIVLLLTLAVLPFGCKEKPPADEHVRTPPRTDFTPEEFGIGRQHTKNRSCNREIDRLLEQARRCYVERPLAECEALQGNNSVRIGKLKNSNRCAH